MSLLDNWFFLSLISALGYGFGCFGIVVLDKFNKGGFFNPLAIGCTFYFFIFLYSLILFLYTKYFSKSDLKNKGILKNYDKDWISLFTNPLYFRVLCFISFFYILGNMCLYGSYISASNAGYCDAISCAQTIVILLLSYFIFGSKIKLINTIGLFLMILSVYIISS